MEIIAIITLYKKNKHHSPPLMPTRTTIAEATQTDQETGAWVLCQEGNKVCSCYGKEA